MTISWAPAIIAAAVVILILANARKRLLVRPWETALLYRNGRFVRAIPPGRHTLFDPFGRTEAVQFQVTEQAGQLGPLDVYAAEGFACRLTLAYTYRIADVQAYHEASAGMAAMRDAGVRLPGFGEALSAAVQAAAACRPLAETLADPQPIAVAAADAVAGRYPAVVLTGATVLRVTLPPEVRRLLTEVETARLQGQAALERARGEQAVLRSLANAARLVRENPELAQLRLLQAIETAKRPATVVFGQPAVGIAPAPHD